MRWARGRPRPPWESRTVSPIPASSPSRARTDRSRPARAAARRMRWAICRARTQVKTWTRMLCSVQWCIGEKDTTRVSLSWRKENSASDWDRYCRFSSEMALSQITCRLNVACDSSVRKRRLARAFGGRGDFVTERHLRPGTGYAISTDLRLLRGEALPAITLRNSYRVDWTVVIGHVTAVVTPTAEGNDRS